MTMFTGAIGAGSVAAEAGKDFIGFLRGSEAARRFTAKGFEPG
jgi:hypothetical protein